MFSKACQYGIRAMLHVAHMSQKGEKVGVIAIAKAIDSPEAFTGKIMNQLSKSGLVQSTKGRSGGFWITDDDRKEINIRRIVEVMDGNKIYVGCGIGISECNDRNPCPMHDQYVKVKEELIKIHTQNSLEVLASQLDGKATLK